MPKVDFRHEGVRKVMALMLPALFAVSVGQIGLLLDTVLATFLETGSVSWLYYSDRLLELPLALFGITIATVILPNLSRQYSADSAQYAKTLAWSVKVVFMLGLPASIALVVLSESLITTLFFQGEMTARDMTMASYSLAAYGLGLLGHMIVKILAPAYFARQDMRTPVRYAVVALVANMILNLALVWHLKHAGLALATSLSAFLNAGLLWYGLRKLGVFSFDKGWLKFFSQVLVASGLMLVFLVVVTPEQPLWLQMDFWWRFGLMIMICIGGGIIYAVGLILTGIRFREMIR